MSEYKPPVRDMIFTLFDVFGFSHEDIDRDTAESVLDEAGKLARDVLSPINKSGDLQGAMLDGSTVKTADGFKDAYKVYMDGGWNSVPFEPEYGGQGMPWAIAFPIQEMWQSANMSFGLCPLLNQGAVEAILSHGSDEQKDYYLPKLISGEWTGTMNLTEPQAGSDLGLLRSKAEHVEGDHYKISGQKIFITYGEHDMAENIIHLVLARTPNAPDDVNGISLFIVPKFMDDGARNAVTCIGLEHKLGIHASPTCTMDFDGASGFLVGEENMGLKYMFTMMNNARLSVGLQGVALADRACQKAWSYASERVQGKENGQRVTIDHHPDVKRMLMEMQARVIAGRLMTYSAALSLDMAAKGDSWHRTRASFFTPIVKSWCTDMALSVASTGMQVHGGMGYIEETGAAQYYRDARILPIYEGTNGIQAADLIFRKVLRDKGDAVRHVMGELEGYVADEYLDSLNEVTAQILDIGVREEGIHLMSSVSSPYLRGFGFILGGAFLSRAAECNPDHETEYGTTISVVNDVYISNILPFAKAYLTTVQAHLQKDA